MDEEEFTPDVPEFDVDDYDLATEVGLEPEEALEVAIEIMKVDESLGNFYYGDD